MREHVHDTWAALAYIPDLGEPTQSGRPPTAPTWVDAVDGRRLTAYQVLAAYADNLRRYWLPTESWDRETMNTDGFMRPVKASAQSYREYGDPGLLIDTARALILGEDQSVEFDDIPEKGTDGKLPPAPLRDWLTDWATREHLTQKLLQGEALSVGLGDGVYVLGNDLGKKRPRLRVYDPGFYFPDTQTLVPGWVDDEFPPIVHVAWEEERDHVTWVRRHTWQMRSLEVPRSTRWGSVAEWTCWYRVVDYRLDRILNNATVYSPEIATAPDVVHDWEDLGIDFLPVVHVPNTPAEWGASILLRVGQVLDDIANADTDLALGSQTAANPALITTGVTAGGLSGLPGEQIGLPSGGTAGWADTSKNLLAQTGYLDKLLDRMAQNTRLAQALLGRIQPNDVPSGYALALGFHPARQLLREARTVRDEKFPLILRFALRMAQSAGWVPAGATPAVRVGLGASLPADLAEAVATVKDLLPVGGLSTYTAVRILVKAGLPIEDAEAEVERIKAEAFDKAVKLVDATGDVAAARAFLGLAPAGPVLPVAQFPGSATT